MDDKTAEEREEARLKKSFARVSAGAGGKAKTPKWSEKHSKEEAARASAQAAAAEAAEHKKAAPQKPKSAGVPVNRAGAAADSDSEDDDRDSRPTEAGKIRGATADDDDDRFSSLMNPASKEDIAREQTIIAAAKGQLTPDKQAVQEAVAAETERLGSIFRVKHTGFKQAWAVPVNDEVRQQNQENERTAQKAEQEREEQEARYQAEREAAFEARRARAKADADAAKAHYAGNPDDDEEPYLNDLELDMCEAMVRLREDPHSFLEPLKKRRENIDGLIYKFVCSDGIEQNVRVGEGKRAADDALSFIEMETPSASDPLPSLRPSKGLTRALYEAVQADPDKPQAMKLIQKYGKVSGSARQMSYRGPCGTAEDLLCGILMDDGNPSRSRRKGLLEPKFRKFGVCGGTSLDGQTNYMFIILASSFDEN